MKDMRFRQSPSIRGTSNLLPVSTHARTWAVAAPVCARLRACLHARKDVWFRRRRQSARAARNPDHAPAQARLQTSIRTCRSRPRRSRRRPPHRAPHRGDSATAPEPGRRVNHAAHRGRGATDCNRMTKMVPSVKFVKVRGGRRYPANVGGKRPSRTFHESRLRDAGRGGPRAGRRLNPSDVTQPSRVSVSTSSATSAGPTQTAPDGSAAE